jgi:hypothetical protein
LKSLTLLIIFLTLFFIGGCDNINATINISNSTNVSETKIINQTDIIIINISHYIDTNTINLSLGIKLCDLIPEENNLSEFKDNKNSCYHYHLTKEFFLCTILKPLEAREICFLSAAGRTRDPSFCDELYDEILKEKCRQYVIQEERGIFHKTSHLNKSDSNMCWWDSQKGFSENKDCICPVGYWKQQFGSGYACIPAICDWIHTIKSTPGRFIQTDGYCITATSINSLNSCDFMETVREKDICIAAYVMKTGNSVSCEKIASTNMRTACKVFTSTSCNSDDDCILTLSQENSCCPVTARVMNKKTKESQEIWRKENCASEELAAVEKKLEQNELSIESMPKKWFSCIFGSGTLTIHLPNEPTTPYCDNGVCRLK